MNLAYKNNKRILPDKRKTRLAKILKTHDDFLKGFLFDFLECDYVVSYRLFLDDSGTHRGSGLLFLAGAMMSVDEWAKLIPLWQERINRCDIGIFHATDVWGSHPERSKIFQELGELIFERKSAVWWGAVDKRDFIETKKEFSLIEDSDFEFLVSAHIGGCPRAMESLGGIGSLGVALEEGHPPIRPRVRERIRNFEIKQGIFEHSWTTYSKKEIPLQVADYLAWNYNRYANTGDESLPFLSLINPANKYRFWGCLFEKNLLRKTFEQLVKYVIKPK